MVATRLAKEIGALRLSRDEWMLRLYGLPYDHPDYVARLPGCTDLMWDTALQALALGTSVILDWNHWTRSSRAESSQRAAAAGSGFVVHFVDVPVDVAISQAESRNSDESVGVHKIDESAVRHFATIFEPPSPGERLEIVRH